MSVRKRSRAFVASVLIAVTIPASLPSYVLAQPKAGTPSKKDLEAAKKAFFEGLDFEEKKDWKSALDRFEQVAKVRMTPQVRFHLALCKENLGMLIEALHDFELAESDAKAEKVGEVMKEAPEHAAAIKPKIPKLTIKVPADIDGISMTLDGNPIDPKGSEETLVNPGSHKIEATAEKRATFSKEITLAEGESKSITVKMPLLKGDGDDDKPPPKDDGPVKPEEPKSSTPVAAYVIGGLGVVSLGLAGYFALQRSSLANELAEACTDPKACPADKEDQVNSGRTYTTLTNVFLVVGVIGVGTGIVLFATAPKGDNKAPPAAALKLTPSAPGANLAGFSLTGTF
jgi:hypothetical protein